MATDDHSNNNSTWTAATNWEISAGSLQNTLTFESPLSLINDNDSSSSPLVLRPSSFDSAPCEITIRLDHKHEIRQVYIRSTARVYEIYYASDMQSGNEYLCTVRCGNALRYDEVSDTYANKGVIAEHPNGSSEHLSERKSKSGSSEEDWVEVKVPDDPTDSPPSKNDSISGGTAQIYYEATAEVEDASSCRSITLRLLSLQDKGCLYIDEVYVFADPVDTEDSEDHTGHVDNSAGSSLMAMLVPTILQLSKSSGINQLKEKDTSELRENSENLQAAPKTANYSNGDHRIKSQGVNETSVLPDQQIIAGVPDMGSKPDFAQKVDAEKAAKKQPDCHSFGHVERTLDQLVSRVSKIEDIFLRFEENMVKPINRIEGRLQQVEQKLEELTKLPQHCSKISSPKFSDSDLNSELPSFSGSENANSESYKQLSSVSCNNLSTSAHAIKLVPGLVITVPELSTDDEDGEGILPTDSQKGNSEEDLAVEEENTVDLDKDLNCKKPKQRVSVDDALASAFAGFLQSTSVHRQNYVQTLAVKAPEFPSEEGPSDEDLAKYTASFSNERELDEDSDSTSVKDLSVESEEAKVKSFTWDCPEETAEVLHNEGREGCDLGDTAAADPEKHSSHSDMSGVLERTGSPNGDESGNLATEIDSSEHFLLSQIHAADHDDAVANIEMAVTADVTTDFRNDGQEDVVAGTDLAITTDGTTKQSMHDGPEIAITTKLTNSTDVATRSNLEALQDVLKLTCASSLVDFHRPVLDVKFTSQDKPEATISIENLFGDVKEKDADIKGEAEVPCPSECKEGGSMGGPSDLITVEDSELVNSAADSHFSLDMDYCKLLDAPTNLGDENLREMSPHSDQKMSAGSLI